MSQSDSRIREVADPFSHRPAMQETERFKLLFGPYETPLFEYGDIVWCEWRGELKIVGMTDAKIPWPVGQKGSSRSLVIWYLITGAKVGFAGF